MDSSEIGSLEEKLKTLLAQLQTEFGIFERLVYKNKNQHRRSSYFQYLLKMVEPMLKAAMYPLFEIFSM
ncbi:hypothetical protein Patl1_04269 [Pistacia atlantica]|uniref:Uncharacterized protein n=1 Tax=Pistacia atlantica TaxID=434234 RepID=A0ACC1BW67_9ROSI|nr:hypothetical protein Patl1_04269 [Pistacia atlantica]